MEAEGVTLICGNAAVNAALCINSTTFFQYNHAVIK